jgi:hypothetical protein
LNNHPTFHLQGFDTAPQGMIDMLKQLSWPDHTSIHILDPLNGKELSLDFISQDRSRYVFVVINTHEGASHHWFDRLILELNQRAGMTMDRIILRSSCLQNPNSPIAHIGSVVDYVTDTVLEYLDILQVPSRLITHHFVCLNNQHRWQRLKLVESLIDCGIISRGKVSYLNAPVSALDMRYREYFPMVLDKKDITWDQGHAIDFPALQGAAFNVITESSYERDPTTRFFETHHLPGLTEKTFKSILLAQFPIFVAPMNTVQCYRDLGFDAFDDVVDHGYDLEPDPEKRLILIAEQIRRCCDYSLSYLQNLAHQNIGRFQKNLDRFRWFAGNHQYDLPKWQKWLSDWKESKEI